MSCGGGGSSSQPTPPPQNPTPGISSISPATTIVGSPAFTLTANGSGFISSSTVLWNGAAKATTYVSSTQLQAAIPATDVANGGLPAVAVSNPAPGGGTSVGLGFTIFNPVPSALSLSPASVNVGSSDFTLAVNGTGFVNDSSVLWNRTAKPTTYVSSTLIQATISATDVATGGTESITVKSPIPAGGTSSALSFSVNNPLPSISSIDPASTTAGNAGFTLTVKGGTFVNGSSILLNGAARTTTFVSSTQLQAALTSADVANGGSISVAVKTLAPAGGTSPALSLTVNNPAPTITSLSPSPLTQVQLAKPLTVTGTGFVPSSSVTWNGTIRATSFLSSTQLQTTISANDVAALGPVNIAVHNPAPGGGDATPVDLEVQNAVPVMTSISPSGAVYGGAAFTAIVNGSGFAPTSEVRWNGTTRPTTLVSSAQLLARISAADIVSLGSANVTVYSPTPGGGTSGTVLFPITTVPTPVLSSTFPTFAYASSMDTSITVYGAAFLPGITIQFNGVDVTTTYYSPWWMSATIPAAQLTSTGTATITAKNSGQGGATSNGISFQIQQNPAPTLASVSPAAVPIGAPASAVTLRGTDFVPGSVVRLNGNDLSTTYSSDYQLQATIGATNLQAFGNNQLTVVNPGPGGGTSSPVVLSTYLPLPTNDFVYSPLKDLIYTSVPSSAGSALGNSIVPVDPYTGNLGTPIWVGSEPGKIAISDDGTTLWVALNGASSVRKVDLTTKTATTVQAYFPGDAHTGLYPITDIAVRPGQPNTIAVACGNVVTILDNGVARTKTGSARLVTFGTSANTLYGDLGIFTIDSTGIASTRTYSSSAYNSDIRYDASHLYLSSGAVLDANTGTLLGTFASSGAVAPDSVVRRAFILNPSVSYSSTYDRVTAFDINTFVAAGSLSVGGVNSNLSTPGMLRWGQDGLAIRTATQLYLLHSTLVRDLSSSATDLAVTSTAPSSATTGSSITVAVTVTNNGPNSASNVVLSDVLPTGVILLSATPSQGTCAGTATIRCNLGGIANSGTSALTLVLIPGTAGTITNTATVSALEPDSSLLNNTTTATTTVTGAEYYPLPTLLGISPSAVATGSGTFTITASGSDFDTASVISLKGNALTTTYVSDTQITAQVDSSSVSSFGWLPVTVVNPAPGGGSSSAVPLTVYQVVSLDSNGLVFDPFTRKLWASVPSTAPQVTGNSLVDIEPTTGVINTPVNIGSEPTRLSLSDDGKYLYAILHGSQELRRMDVPSKTAGARFPTTTLQGGQYAADNLAVMPGNHDTVAADGYSAAVHIYDVSGATGTVRADAGFVYAGEYLGWTDSSHLYSYDSGLSPSKLHRFTVSATSAQAIDETNVSGFWGNFQNCNGLLYSDGGGVVDPSPAYPAPPRLYGTYEFGGTVAVDCGCKHVYFFTGANYSYTSQPFGLAILDKDKFIKLGTLPMSSLTSNGNSSVITDLVRWGQDGLAFRMKDSSYSPTVGAGKIVLVRGAFVLPELLASNPTPALTTISPSSISAGGGNIFITVIGDNFVPGATVLWNGQERSTTFVNATRLKAAIPTADLTTSGAASITVSNPGGAASSLLTFTIN